MLKTPLGTLEDAYAVAEKLVIQLGAPPVMPELAPRPQQRQISEGESEPISFQDPFRFISQYASAKSEDETKRNEMNPETRAAALYDNRKREVKRLLDTFPEIKATQIIEQVWNVHAGGGKSYKDAKEEYNQMRLELGEYIVHQKVEA